LCIDEDGKLYCSVLIKTGTEPELMDVLSDDGSLEFSFGEPEKIDDLPLGYTNQVKVLTRSQRLVLLGFITTGQVKIYDSQGKLSRNILTLRDYLKNDFDFNLKQFARSAQGKKVGYKHLFESVKVIEDDIYFLRSLPDRYEIIQMDKNFRLTKRYTYKFKKNPEKYCLDFNLRESQDKGYLEFLIIELNPEAIRVIILTPEKMR